MEHVSPIDPLLLHKQCRRGPALSQCDNGPAAITGDLHDLVPYGEPQIYRPLRCPLSVHCGLFVIRSKVRDLRLIDEDPRWAIPEAQSVPRYLSGAPTACMARDYLSFAELI